MTTLPLSELYRALPGLANSHHKALAIAAKRQPPPNILNAHSPGIIELWSLPDPHRREMHIVQGGITNGDKRLLQRVARGSKSVPSWVVPKSVAVGDEVVIYIRGYGLFATARINSRPWPRTDRRNRYGAGLKAIKLIEPPISLTAIRRNLPDFGWSQYPRSITTLSPEIAERIRVLITKRRETGIQDFVEGDIPSANIDELRKLALRGARGSVAGREGVRVYRVAAKAVRSYVLRRADGHCEGCTAAAPFRGSDGLPFLETHHTRRLADGGPDHPAKVIGLCPNCHRRAHLSDDRKSFNASLIRKLAKLEANFQNPNRA
jgi:hypothetical protein